MSQIDRFHVASPYKSKRSQEHALRTCFLSLTDMARSPYRCNNFMMISIDLSQEIKWNLSIADTIRTWKNVRYEEVSAI